LNVLEQKIENCYSNTMSAPSKVIELVERVDMQLNGSRLASDED